MEEAEEAEAEEVEEEEDEEEEDDDDVGAEYSNIRGAASFLHPLSLRTGSDILANRRHTLEVAPMISPKGRMLRIQRTRSSSTALKSWN